MDKHSSRFEVMTSRARTVVIAANLVMIGIILVHDADHVRQAANWSYTIRLSLVVVNLFVYAPSIMGLIMALRRLRRADIMTCFNGLLIGASFSEVHLWRPTLPLWDLWNDNFFVLAPTG
jgi:hypothetical protein